MPWPAPNNDRARRARNALRDWHQPRDGALSPARAANDLQRLNLLWADPSRFSQCTNCCGFAAVMMAAIQHQRDEAGAGAELADDNALVRLLYAITGVRSFAALQDVVRPLTAPHKSLRINLPSRMGWRMTTQVWHDYADAYVDLALSIGLQLLFKFDVKWRKNDVWKATVGKNNYSGEALWNSFLAFSNALVGGGYLTERPADMTGFEADVGFYLKRGDIGVPPFGIPPICHFASKIFGLNWRMRLVDFKPSMLRHRLPTAAIAYPWLDAANVVESPDVGPVTFPWPTWEEARGGWGLLQRRLNWAYETNGPGTQRGMILGVAKYNAAGNAAQNTAGLGYPGYRDVVHWVYLPPADPRNGADIDNLAVYTWGRRYTLRELCDARRYIPVWGCFLSS